MSTMIINQREEQGFVAYACVLELKTLEALDVTCYI